MAQIALLKTADSKNYTQNPCRLSFSKIDTRHIGLLRSFFERFPSRSCDFSIGGVLIWSRMFEYEYAVAYDSLIIKGYMPEVNMHVFYEPCGLIDRDEYRNLISDYCKINGMKGLLIIQEEEKIGIDHPKEALFGEYLSEYKEYLYPIEKFCGFPGKKMEKKRNHLHYFDNHYPEVTCSKISETDIEALISFTREFKKIHGDSTISDYECDEIINVLNNYNCYNFHGIVVKENDKVIGYSFGEKIGDTFIIHAEKGDIQYRGIYQKVSSELASYVASQFPEIAYLNREDDMGDESLRLSKESYHPTIYIHKKRYFVL